jgi:hypothetical protein
MARVSFKTPTGEVEEHDFEFESITNQDYIHIETVTGMDTGEFIKACQSMSATAWTALVQLIWKREGRDVRFADVSFLLASIVFDDGSEDESSDSGESDPN